MSIFSWLTGLFENDSANYLISDADIADSTNDAFDGSAFSSIDLSWDDNAINPVNGLPMVGGAGGVDVEGNPYGTDFSHEDTFGSGSSFDDSFSSMDDSFSSGNGFDDW